MLQVGDQAPDFTLPDKENSLHSLSDYVGKWLLLYFYPKDFTLGCTQEAYSFRDNFQAFKDKVAIVGISGDSVDSHQKFSEKHNLAFTLLADPARKIIKAYGANGLIFAKRTSFLINPQGKIEKIYPKVNPATHAREILAYFG